MEVECLVKISFNALKTRLGGKFYNNLQHFYTNIDKILCKLSLEDLQKFERDKDIYPSIMLCKKFIEFIPVMTYDNFFFVIKFMESHVIKKYIRLLNILDC